MCQNVGLVYRSDLHDQSRFRIHNYWCKTGRPWLLIAELLAQVPWHSSSFPHVWCFAPHWIGVFLRRPHSHSLRCSPNRWHMHLKLFSEVWSGLGRVCLNTADYHRLDFKDHRLNFETFKPLKLDGKFKLEGSQPQTMRWNHSVLEIEGKKLNLAALTWQMQRPSNTADLPQTSF